MRCIFKLKVQEVTRGMEDKMRNVIRSIRKGSAQWNEEDRLKIATLLLKAGYSVKIGRQQIESTGGKKQMEYTVEYWGGREVSWVDKAHRRNKVARDVEKVLKDKRFIEASNRREEQAVLQSMCWMAFIGCEVSGNAAQIQEERNGEVLEIPERSYGGDR